MDGRKDIRRIFFENAMKQILKTFFLDGIFFHPLLVLFLSHTQAHKFL